MAIENIKLNFENDFQGKMVAPTGEVKIGNVDGGLMPYNLLFGALGSCFYATFLSLTKKMRLTFSSVSLDISGKKRDQEIATLEYVNIDMIINDPSDEKKIQRCVDLGAKYCSIHETISKVGKININVTFA